MALDSDEGRKALLDRLGKEPFGRLAAEHGATERELVDYLLSLGEEGEPDDQPWWPEALARLLRRVPIRDVAWIFRQPAASIRRAIDRAGLETARVGADEIAVPRGEAPRLEPEERGSDRPLIELPVIEPELEPLPDPAWSTWAPIDSLVDATEGGARPVAEATVRPADVDFPPDADGPIEDPADTFGWRAMPEEEPADDSAARRSARSGNVRLVRPEDERTPQSLPAPPSAPRERRRRKVAASPVRMRTADEVDLSELLPRPRRASPPAAPGPAPRTARPSRGSRRFAWEIQLGSGRTVVVAADDALSALARVADVASASELVGATLRRVPLAG
jgi:hypothetical protein